MAKFTNRGLASPDLADDDPVGAKTQRRPQQHANRYLPRTLRVWRASLESHDMPGQIQLGSILDGHDAFVFTDLGTEQVEQSRLARPGSSGHDDRPLPVDGVDQ